MLLESCILVDGVVVNARSSLCDRNIYIESQAQGLRVSGRSATNIYRHTVYPYARGRFLLTLPYLVPTMPYPACWPATRAPDPTAHCARGAPRSGAMCVDGARIPDSESEGCPRRTRPARGRREARYKERSKLTRASRHADPSISGRHAKPPTRRQCTLDTTRSTSTH